jgi:hypothetical protein
VWISKSAAPWRRLVIAAVHAVPQAQDVHPVKSAFVGRGGYSLQDDDALSVFQIVPVDRP